MGDAEVKQEPLSDWDLPNPVSSAQGCGNKVSRKLRRVTAAPGQVVGPEQLSWSLALLWVLLLEIGSTWK